ncbi:MAG: hypothetical protein AAF806_31190 [Bacteroidota bacterium]
MDFPLLLCSVPEEEVFSAAKLMAFVESAKPHTKYKSRIFSCEQQLCALPFVQYLEVARRDFLDVARKGAKTQSLFCS